MDDTPLGLEIADSQGLDGLVGAQGGAESRVLIRGFPITSTPVVIQARLVPLSMQGDVSCNWKFSYWPTRLTELRNPAERSSHSPRWYPPSLRSV